MFCVFICNILKSYKDSNFSGNKKMVWCNRSFGVFEYSSIRSECELLSKKKFPRHCGNVGGISSGRTPQGAIHIG